MNVRGGSAGKAGSRESPPVCGEPSLCGRIVEAADEGTSLPLTSLWEKLRAGEGGALYLRTDARPLQG